MNIQSVKSAYGAQIYGPAKSGKTSAPEKTVAVPNEKVQLSDESISMQKVREKLESVPEVRIQLVEEMKTKIKFNGYPFETNMYKAIEKMIKQDVL